MDHQVNSYHLIGNFDIDKQINDWVAIELITIDNKEAKLAINVHNLFAQEGELARLQAGIDGVDLERMILNTFLYFI